MIPKIIHLCWLSGDTFPESIKRCLETFPLYLEDYEINLWGKIPEDVSCLGGMKVTEMHFDLDSTPWTKEAFEAKKYAFAADYIRLYALYTYGGIYLDADVVVYKSFDELLHLPYFIGCDQIRAFEAAVIGAEKGCFWVKEVLDTYEGKHFIKNLPADVLDKYSQNPSVEDEPCGLVADGYTSESSSELGTSVVHPSSTVCETNSSFTEVKKNKYLSLTANSDFVPEYDMMELPVRFHHVLTEKGYKFHKVDSVENVNYRECNVNYRKLFVFAKDYFNSRDAVKVRQTAKSFCAHNYAGSWQKKTKKSFKYRLPKQLLKIIYTVGQATWARNKYAWFQIPFE